MLVSLHVKNYVIIDELMLDFQSGMTVISGETGAGKSIIMDALELAIGGRAEIQVIKHGQTRCEITAVFDVSKNALAKTWLIEQDLIESEREFDCIFRRVISQDGRSKSTINGQAFPVQKTRELAQYLMDIHGQHEHQSLLKPEVHRTQLDSYAEHAALTRAVTEHYKIWQALNTELEKLSSHPSDTQVAQKSLLNYQLEELIHAEIEEGESEKLHQEHTTLSQVNTWLENAQGIADILSSDEEISLRRLLQTALNLLPSTKNLHQDLPLAWKNLQALLENAQIQCQEAEEEARHMLNSMESDPERLAHIENRLHQLHALARKHHTTMEALPQLKKELMLELEGLEKNEEKIILLKEKLVEVEKKYHESAQALSKSRQHFAIKLGKAVTEFIRQLGMVHGCLEVVLETQPQIRGYGYDKVEYYIMTNPSQPPRPLGKVASGGELSRISLAIEVVTTQKNEDLTRLFDEVDVGIGGQTAAVVGKLMRTLGEKSQVLCITHQPQTASQGHQHLLVSKKIEQHDGENIACFYVNELTQNEKVNEIARMLGGFEMTSHTLAHAEELLASSSA